MADSTRSLRASMEEDPIYRLKKLEEMRGIKEYYKTFDSIRRCVDLPEDFLLSWFVAGLRMDARKEVRSFRPQTVIQAYAYGRMYEIAYPNRSSPPLLPVPIQEFSSSTSFVSFPISLSQEDDNQVLQPELQSSDRKSNEELQDSDQSTMPNSANTDDANSINGLLMDKREEEPDQESVRKCPDLVIHQAFDGNSEIQECPDLVAHEVFDEIPLIKEHLKDDLLEVMSEPANSNSLPFVHLEEEQNQEESIDVKEPTDLIAYQVFDEMPQQDLKQVGSKAFEVNNVKATKPLILVNSECTDLLKLMNGLTSQDDMAMDCMGVQIFDPGGGLHKSGEDVLSIDATNFLINSSNGLLIVEVNECGLRKILVRDDVEFTENWMPYDRGKVQPMKGNVVGYKFNIEDGLILVKKNQDFLLLIAHFDGEIPMGNDREFIALSLPYDRGKFFLIIDDEEESKLTEGVEVSCS